MDGGRGHTGIPKEDKDSETQPYSDDVHHTTAGLNPVPEEDDTIFEGHYVRDTEKPEARKKSDSFSRARAVSTASIDSNRHGSISNRPITRGDSIAEEAETEIEPPLETAEDTSSSHAQPLHGRRQRRRTLSATSGSKTDSSPENSLSSYSTSAEHEFNSSTPSVTISVEQFTMMQKEISMLKQTVNEHGAQITKLNKQIEHLQLINMTLRSAQKDKDEFEPTKSATGPSISIPDPEHCESLNDRYQPKARQTSTSGTTTNDASTCVLEESISDEAMTTEVVIPCEAQTSTKSTNSAPFFLDRNNSGYQMCINLSRSEDFNPELTFALVIMRGKLDKTLSWPFNRKMILTVISNDASKHDAIAIQPKSQKSFQRPKSDLNEPFPFLKKHYTVLFDGGFINDDRVAIQVSVT